jgi:hypothetical protein
MAGDLSFMPLFIGTFGTFRKKLGGIGDVPEKRSASGTFF